MNITIKPTNCHLFKNIPEGNVFYFGGYYYLKIKPLGTKGDINTINLEGSTQHSFGDDCEVELKISELIIK